MNEENELSIMSNATADELLPALDAIEHVPDELLENGSEDEIKKYFEDALPNIQTYGVWECSLAIGKLLVTNAIPAAKLLKIKKYIKELGGAWNAAKLLVGATSAGEKLQALKKLISLITGYSNVKEKCGL